MLNKQHKGSIFIIFKIRKFSLESQIERAEEKNEIKNDHKKKRRRRKKKKTEGKKRENNIREEEIKNRRKTLFFSAKARKQLISYSKQKFSVTKSAF
jgi:hypothetical protein